MSKTRREFFRDLLAVGAVPGFFASPAAARLLGALDDPSAAQELNPDFDPKAYEFWSGFLSSDAKPIVRMTRGGGGESNLQPVFWHFNDKDGFRNAAALDANKLIPKGDVVVAVNTSAIKIAPQDQSTFDRLQNAQVRVDMAQKSSILPSVIEPLAYTFVSGMKSGLSKPKPTGSASGSSSKSGTGGSSKTGSGKGSKSSSSRKSSSVQSIGVSDDPTWQKMQNILLPAGQGRWALNLEAQKKDSLFHKIIQTIIGGLDQFAPLIGLPGIAMTALQSFNALYGAIHSMPVQIIKSNPQRVFATQDAVQKTGSPESVSGLMLNSGTYVLIPANRAPAPDQLRNLHVIQGRVVPQEVKREAQGPDVDAAAAETLPGVTYVTFEIEVQPTSIISSSGR
jgi:hypothetical protein